MRGGSGIGESGIAQAAPLQDCPQECKTPEALQGERLWGSPEALQAGSRKAPAAVAALPPARPAKPFGRKAPPARCPAEEANEKLTQRLEKMKAEIPGSDQVRWGCGAALVRAVLGPGQGLGPWRLWRRLKGRGHQKAASGCRQPPAPGAEVSRLAWLRCLRRSASLRRHSGS